MRRVIACLDVKDDRVVKGVRFRLLRDVGEPAGLAQAYAAQGADEIVLLDVSATPERRRHAVATVRAVRTHLAIPLTVGGGIRSVDDARALLDAGADKVAVNAAAVARPRLLDELSRRFGAQCVVLSIDALRRPRYHEVIVRSGAAPTGIDAVEWARTGTRHGAGEILLTGIDRDGTRAGYDLELIRNVAASVKVPVVASGGGATVAHMLEAFAAGADAVLAASLLHDGVMTIGALKRELAEHGEEVRP